MPHYLETLILGVYYACLGTISLYGAHRLLTIVLYYARRSRRPAAAPPPKDWPVVTVQLPLFNEPFVAERLIESVCAMDYPADRLEVQVLDDSTDETTEIVAAVAARMQAEGRRVVHIRRPDRVGYKAGALEYGLKQAAGDLIAIFDADFVPNADFLKRTVPHFTAPDIGMVQVRWGHLNRGYSLLTRMQSVMLDGHLAIESPSRCYSGRFFNFNGTAGVWHRDAIEQAGGWQHDTLTEDLDLSYRAQLRGWRFLFLNDSECPAELPVEMNAFKCQQHRWTKGAVETARKLLPAIWKAPIPMPVKLEATVHLTSNIAYLLMIVVCLLMWPVIEIRQADIMRVPLFVDAVVFFFASVAVAAFYGLGQREVSSRDWLMRLWCVPLMMSLGIGLCVSNARAVMEALLGRRTGFIRTPKLGIVGSAKPRANRSFPVSVSAVTAVELGFATYFLFLVIDAVQEGNFVVVPFLVLFVFGFGYVGMLSTWSLIRSSRPPLVMAGAADGIEPLARS